MNNECIFCMENKLSKNNIGITCKYCEKDVYCSECLLKKDFYKILDKCPLCRSENDWISKKIINNNVNI